MKLKITAVIYIITIALFIGADTFRFAYNFFTMPQEQVLDISWFEQADLKQTGENTFLSVTNNPRLILHEYAGFDVRTIKYTLSKGGTGIRTLYYTTESQPEFSGKNGVLPQYNAENEIRYILPESNVQKVRLDIGGTFAEEFVIDEIVINYRPSYFEYISLTAMDIFKIIVVPLILSSVIFYIFDLFEHYKKYIIKK